MHFGYTRWSTNRQTTQSFRRVSSTNWKDGRA
jgi:hypothetical protein